MVAQKLETDLAVIQRKRAELEALETQYAKDLEEARAVQEGDASQIAELEPVVAQDVRAIHVLNVSDTGCFNSNLGLAVHCSSVVSRTCIAEPCHGRTTVCIPPAVGFSLVHPS